MAFSEGSALYDSRFFSFILGPFGILASESSFNVNWPPGAAPRPTSVLKLSHTRGRSAIASPHCSGVEPYSYSIEPYTDSLEPYRDSIEPYIDSIDLYRDSIEPYRDRISSMSALTKLKYVGMYRAKLLHIYALHVQPSMEY